MKESFRDELGMSETNNIMLNKINDIIEEYAQEGYKLTLRQLYYQLVSRDIIPNKQAEYAKLSTILVKGRMAGIVDWDAIEDRLRVPYLPYWVHGIRDAIEDTIEQYRLDRQKGQRNYIELWVEKDALSSVLKRITKHYHIRLMVNRGYSSCTAMHDSYERFKDALQEGRNVIILYLGDHDPSGLDMVRDIRERTLEFLKNSYIEKNNGDDLYDDEIEEMFSVEHVALLKEHIEKYNPPPNPAKITDPRAGWYIKNHGRTSWEVDALDPDTLHKLIHNKMKRIMDMDKFNDMLECEKRDMKKLREMLESAVK